MGCFFFNHAVEIPRKLPWFKQSPVLTFPPNPELLTLHGWILSSQHCKEINCIKLKQLLVEGLVFDSVSGEMKCILCL